MRSKFQSKVAAALTLCSSLVMLFIPATSSAGTFDGEISGSSALGAGTPCGFEMTYSGTPGTGSWVNLPASSFAGAAIGSTPACDLNEVRISSDLEIFWGGSSHIAHLHRFEIHLEDLGCTYKTDSIMGLWSSWDALGNWDGTVSAIGLQFPCSAFAMQVSLAEGLFHP